MNDQKPEPVIARYLLSCVIFFVLGFAAHAYWSTPPC